LRRGLNAKLGSYLPQHPRLARQSVRAKLALGDDLKHTDRPIFKPAQDLLRRRTFSLQLARAIDNFASPSDGFVMALEGKWGEGKSSVVALIVRYLRHLEMLRADELLRDREDAGADLDYLERCAELCETVEWRLKSLSSSCSEIQRWSKTYKWAQFDQWFESRTDAIDADRYWRLQSHFEDNRKTIVVNFSPWLIAGRSQLATALLSDLARALGNDIGEDVREAFAGLLKRLSELASFANVGASVGGIQLLAPVATLTEKISKKYSEKLAKGDTLDEVRLELKKVLGRLENKQVLVVVDDLDRLPPKDALEAIALVKSLGDLPNVIYLLCYDSEMIAKLLSVAMEIDGSDYLKKIIQYSVRLPRLRDTDLGRLFDSDLTLILGELSPLQQRRLNSTWHFIFRHYVRNPREVRRLINVVSVSAAAGTDRLDPVDILFLETMRLYEPEIYEWIRENLNDLTD